MNRQLDDFNKSRIRPYKEAIDGLSPELKRSFYSDVLPGILQYAMRQAIDRDAYCLNITIGGRLSPEEGEAIAKLAGEGYLLCREMSPIILGGGQPLHDLEDAAVYLLSCEGFEEKEFRRYNRSREKNPALNMLLASERAEQN